MARHGGALERTVVLHAAPAGPGTAGDGDDDGEPDTFRELHLVRFPDEAAFRAYRTDPELAALASLREAAIAVTEIWTGTDGPTFT